MANKKIKFNFGRRKPVEVTRYVDRSELMLKDPDKYFKEARKRATQELKAERRGHSFA